MNIGILIIGSRIDPHVSQIESELGERGVQVKIFDQYLEDLFATFDGKHWSSPALEWLHSFDGSVVWNRAKRPLIGAPQKFHIQDYRPEADAAEAMAVDFRRAEVRSSRTALMNIVEMRSPNTYIFNYGENFGTANYKPIQLEVAQSLGLQIPSTMIGNKGVTLGSKFSHEVMVKPQTGLNAGGRGGVPGAVIPLPALIEGDLATGCPQIFQECIKKRYELRITIVESRVFPVKIKSQDRASTSIDWRYGQRFDDMFEPTTISDDLTGRLLRYMHKMSLDYGAFDLAVDRHGEEIFFECNPSGQWLWIEDNLRLPIQSALTEALIGKATEIARKKSHA